MVCIQRALQEEADNTLDMAETAMAALEEEKAQLILQNGELSQQLASDTSTQHALATHGQDMAAELQVPHTLTPCCPLFNGKQSAQLRPKRRAHQLLLWSCQVHLQQMMCSQQRTCSSC